MGMLVETFCLEKNALRQWHTQAENVTTNLKFKVDFTLPALSATNIVTWKCFVDYSTKGIYDMILGQDVFIELGLNLKLSEHVIKGNDVPFKGYTTPMVELGMYAFKYLNTGKTTPEESFTNAYDD